MPKNFSSTSPNETQKLANKLAKKLDQASIITLEGNLGSGKTTFIQGIAHSLGIKENITSPTFTLIKQYPLPQKKGVVSKLTHIDLYRLSPATSLEELSIEEFITDPEAIVVIEWPNKIKKFLPKKNIYKIKMSYQGKNNRKITITYPQLINTTRNT